MNNIPDLQARKSALDITHSFLVQAPAGSGKTELLTQRFLKLLAYVETPEEIIAITFTNKAAAEMRARIIAALEKAATLPEPESDHAKATWRLASTVLKHSIQKNWNLRENPNRLRVLTMDALSLQIAQKLPISSKLGAQLDIADDAEDLYKKAIQTILLSPPKDAPWLEAIKALLLYTDNKYDHVEKLLVTLLGKRDQWLPLMLLGNDTDQKRQILEQELRHVNELVLQDEKRLLPNSLKIEMIALAIYASATLPQYPAGQTSWSLLEKQDWLFIANMLLTQADQLRKKSDKNIGFPSASSSKSKPEKAMFEEYKQRFQTLVNALEHEHHFVDWLAEIRKLPHLHYNETQWQVLDALLTLLPLCAAQLRLVFSQHNQVDYIENAQSALYALGDADNPTDISLSLDHKIQHLLVDEFQDTSSNQFQLLEKLTAGWSPEDGRTLFLVGDPMQSIYRFRQAEVGLFLHAKHYGIGHVLLDFIALSSNFRSTAQIVHWTNQYFQTIFPEQEKIQLGAIPYNAAHAIHDEQNNSYAECLYFTKDETLAEERYLINTIQAIQQVSPTESIAILIRNRSHLNSIIPLLQSANIAYQAVDIETLGHKPIIHDLLSLTRACIHLGDRVAWLACLRAPWCGLTLQDLWSLTYTAPAKTLWELVGDENIVATLSEEGQQRVSHIKQALTFAVQQRQRISLRDIIEKTWEALGGKNLLTHQDQQQDIDKFFSVLEQITDPIGVIQFSLLERKIEKLFAATQHAQVNPVQIMTIHKAKGLEFDHVFLPKLHKTPRSNDKGLIAWVEYPDADNIHHLLMAPISEINTADKTYDYIQKQQQQKLLLELDRVLYVATTRAKKCLYLTATLELDEAQKVVPPRNSSLLSRIWNAHPTLFQIYKNDIAQEPLEQPASSSEHYLQRIMLSSLQQLAHTTQGKEAYSPEQKNAPELRLPEHRHEATLGSIIHQLIEEVTQQGISWWQALNASTQHTFIKALCQQFNLPPDLQEEGVKKIQRAINNLTQDSQGQWIIQKHSISQTEYVVYHYHHGQWHKRIMDRVLCDSDDKYWIIDYKTTEKKDPELSTEVFLEQAAQEHTKQLLSYQQALSHITGEQDIQLALYFPLVAPETYKVSGKLLPAENNALLHTLIPTFLSSVKKPFSK